MLGDDDDAEEAVQDAFVRVHGSLARFRDGEPFEPWFFRILANRCRTAGAMRARRHAVIEYGELPTVSAPGGASDGLERAEWRAQVAGALAALSDDQREAFLLRHVEGMDYDDMASATGAGLSTLRMRVKRACDALRVRLDAGALHG